LAALRILFKYTYMSKSTNSRPLKVRAISKVATDRQAADSQREMNEAMNGVPEGPEAGALQALLEDANPSLPR